ncbi:Transcription factor, fungi [Penicillium expansum]|nr:Transcription factor, fungi [Penicillium expansum]KGO69361.1 Transcription factor, fungi [Penicillium expansum]
MLSHQMAPTAHTHTSQPTRQRQRTGRACEECRRRKLRCDALQPRCGVCVEAGITCEVNSQRQPRGPKKGYLKALRNRVILHQRRYLGWARSASKKISRRCLQYAVWTLASLLSAQFQHLQDSFYQETKRSLEFSYLSGDSDNLVDTEEIQAWILIATYESMRTFHRSAWMSAGRAFRLVQLMRLHEIDSPTNPPVADADLIETEEKRRVFWMAYFLDHLLSMRNNWPITLNEHVICTRLPAPDMEFQNGQPVLGAFLSEAIMDVMPQTTSPFNECAILATICGRSLFQAQQYSVRFVYGDMAPNWTDQHQWLDNVLTNRLQILSQHYPSPTQVCDPMLSFAHIMGQASVIHLYKGMESIVWAVNEGALVLEYRRRALSAAQEIVKQAKGLIEFYFFKVHPLMPIPLLLCVEFLYSNRGSDAAFNSLLQELLQIFRQLKNPNDPTQSYIHLLELSCTNASIDLVKENSTSS